MSETLLPIHEIRDELIERLQRANRLVLKAPTGSGKSTQVPQMLLDSGLTGDGLVIILQPRRLAARMLAARVARERNVRLGEEVGYQIRLDNVSGPATRILYVTEGILLRRMLADSSLRGVSAILFDEFHERHLFGDLSLARALDLQESRRPDLRLIVMSATLQGEALGQYLAPCEVLESAGRTFPVEVEHLAREPREEPVWDRAAEAVEREFPHTSGNALVFMPGAYEIQRTIQAIQHRMSGVPVLPLHGELSPDQQ
ncbi:MAG TPA: DEAD/DEAH box helicase, partial [Chthoniobacterales bacterium]